MKKKLHGVNVEKLLEAMKRCRYTVTESENGRYELKRSSYHIILTHKRGRAVIKIHYDVTTAVPPFHRARQRGKDLKRELNAIMWNYRALRE